MDDDNGDGHDNEGELDVTHYRSSVLSAGTEGNVANEHSLTNRGKQNIPAGKKNRWHETGIRKETSVLNVINPQRILNMFINKCQFHDSWRRSKWQLQKPNITGNPRKTDVTVQPTLFD